MDDELLKRADNYIKQLNTKQRFNQFDEWKDMILYLKSNNLSTKSILEFLLKEDAELSKKYKGREATAYTLLAKYVKKHFVPGTKINLNKSKIEKENIDNSKEDETRKKLIDHFGKEYFDNVGYDVAKTIYHMKN